MPKNKHENDTRPGNIPPPLPKRNQGEPPPPPRRTRPSSPSTQDKRFSKRTLVLAALTVLLLILLGLGQSGLLPVGGPSSTTSQDYTGAEVAEIVRLLMNDSALQADYLNTEGSTEGYARRIPYPLWHALLGEPHTKASIVNDAHWIYLASDGQVGITIYQYWNAENAPIPWLQIDRIDNTVSISGAAANKDQLREFAIRMKARIDKELESSGALANLEKQRSERKQAAEAEQRQRELENKRRHEEYLKQREAEHQQALQLADTLFGRLPLSPEYQISAHLDIGDVSFEPVKNTESLISTLRKGQETREWDALLDLLEIKYGQFQGLDGTLKQDKKYNTENVQKAYERLKLYDDRYRVFAATVANLKETNRIYFTDEMLHIESGATKHPSQAGWIIGWNPFMLEGFIAPSGYELRQEITALQASIDKAVRLNREKRELGETVPPDAEIRRQAVQDSYRKLREKYGGDLSVAGVRSAEKAESLPKKDSTHSADEISTLVAPFSGEDAANSQSRWADYLDLPVKQTASNGMAFVLIPPGEFTMGDDLKTNEGIALDGPPHRVVLTRPFYLSIHEVTVSQFDRFRQETGGVSNRPADPSKDDLPVVNVTWYDAAEFCEWLSRQEGRKYRLPTEAEWEYACRAGNDDAWVFGQNQPIKLKEEIAKQHLWFYLNAEKRQPVGTKLPNSFGLHDMQGNVREWCSDWFSADFYKTSPRENPAGPNEGQFKTIRGGWYSANLWQARPAHRHGATPPDKGGYGVGFRVVCEIVDSARQPQASSGAKDNSETPKSREQRIAELTEQALNKKISLTAPYPKIGGGGRRDRISVQYAAREIAKQAGFQFDLEASMKNAGRSGRLFITPNIRNKKCRDALETILKPVGLTYRTEEGVLTLEKRE